MMLQQVVDCSHAGIRTREGNHFHLEIRPAFQQPPLPNLSSDETSSSLSNASFLLLFKVE